MTDVAAAVTRIRVWGEARDWRGHDPYDALTSPYAHALTLGTPLGRRLLTQLVKASPLNLRPLLRVPRTHNAKAIGLVASAYLRLGERGQADRWLDWLDEHRADGGRGWAYPFDVQTRFFHYAAGTPNAIATCFVAHAFLDAGRPAPAEDAAEFMVERLLRVDGRRSWFAYLEGENELVHNANTLCCSVLARLGHEAAASALETTLAAQRPDGSWPYADSAHGDWVDNFHTAYVLESLTYCNGTEDAVARGRAFWEDALFLADGTPRYSTASTYPLDAHCYASAIDAWLALGDRSRAGRTAALLIERMLDSSGYVHFQQRRFMTNRVPFVRWTTAPSFRALAGLLAA